MKPECASNPWTKLNFVLIYVLLLVTTKTKAQFRSQDNRERFQEPYNRPTTSRPDSRFLRPTDYRYSDDVRYRSGYEYRINQRGGNELTARERDRLRFNYNEDNPEYHEFELRNTIFDRWRPDLQGQKRPGETPGVTLPLAEDVFVTTDSGKIQGFYVYLYDEPTRRPEDRPALIPLELQRHLSNVTVFLGIPYAQPPVIEGRFKPPRRVRNWHTTWQAIDYSPACPQNLKYVGFTKGIRSGINEDCLYLNIFTPSLSVNARERYPVMFHIHGGEFDHGAGSQFAGHLLSAWGNVVVVTINYRLGALGFLSTGDYHSPGNYGLMDMAMSLEWVYNNIRFFNGDKNRITVFGSGSGGAAAGLLAILPKTRNWVSQVIGQSGSPLAEWAAIDDPYRVQNTSRVFGLAMGCNVENSYKILHCLVNRDYEELATAPIIPDIGTFPWSPVVDGNFTVPEDSWYEDWAEEDFHILPEMPLNMYEKNMHHPLLRYLTGVNRDEAANMAFEDVRLSRNGHEVTEEFFNARIRDWVLHYNYTLNPDGAFDAIKWMYTFWPDPQNRTHIREEYINMLSDALYKSPVDHIVKVLTNSTNKRAVSTYYYLLNTTVEALKLPHWREIPTNIEYYFITGAPFMDPELYPEIIRISRHQWTEGDRNMSQFMMKAFANFAQWGNPTQSQAEPIKVNWEPTVEGSFRYLSINTTFNTSIHYNYKQPQVTFWYEYMPQVVRELIPTPPPPRNPWFDMKEPVTATMYGLLAFIVVLFLTLVFCFGLWKSAKLQRNKALDDLSCYSTENLSLFKESSDFEVRKYIEKLNEAAKHNPVSNTGTLNTVMSVDHSHQSRPITPGSAIVSNVKPNNQHSVSEPDNTYSTIKKVIPQQEVYQSEPYQFRYQSVNGGVYTNPPDRKTSTPLESSTVVIADTSKQLQGNTKEPYIIENHNIPIPQVKAMPQYAQQTNRNVPDQYNHEAYRQILQQISQNKGIGHHTTNHQELGHNKFRDYNNYEIPSQTETHSVPSSRPMEATQQMRSASAQPIGIPENHYQPKPAERHHFQIPMSQEELRKLENSPYSGRQIQPQHFNQSNGTCDGYSNVDQHSIADVETQNRATTPSAVTFEISMKPARSLGTISNASGLIINTDL